MLRGFFGNLIFAIIARMLCGNHLKSTRTAYRALFQKTNSRYCCNKQFTSRRFETIWASIVVCKGHWQIPSRNVSQRETHVRCVQSVQKIIGFFH